MNKFDLGDKVINLKFGGLYEIRKWYEINGECFYSLRDYAASPHRFIELCPEENLRRYYGQEKVPPWDEEAI